MLEETGTGFGVACPWMTDKSWVNSEAAFGTPSGEFCLNGAGPVWGMPHICIKTNLTRSFLQFSFVNISTHLSKLSEVKIFALPFCINDTDCNQEPNWVYLKKQLAISQAIRRPPPTDTIQRPVWLQQLLYRFLLQKLYIWWFTWCCCGTCGCKPSAAICRGAEVCGRLETSLFPLS